MPLLKVQIMITIIARIKVFILGTHTETPAYLEVKLRTYQAVKVLIEHGPLNLHIQSQQGKH